MYYSIIWLENRSNQGWVELRDMTPEVYGQKFDEYATKATASPTSSATSATTS